MLRLPSALLCAACAAALLLACPGPVPPGDSDAGPDGGPFFDGGFGEDGGSGCFDCFPDGGCFDCFPDGGFFPHVTARDQAVRYTTQVIVDEGFSNGPGWFVVYADDGNGGLGELLGHAYVRDRFEVYRDVTLSRRVRHGERLHAVLHADLGQVFNFEYPGPDAPVQNDGGLVASTFQVTVLPGTPDVGLHVYFDGSSYAWDTTPPEYAFAIVGTRPGPSTPAPLTLKAGWRYQLYNAHFDGDPAAGYPLELVTLGATPDEDTVLLSQARSGTLELDPSVNWTAEQRTPGGPAVIHTFTVSPSLAAALTGYRCATAPGTQRGTVTVSP